VISKPRIDDIINYAIELDEIDIPRKHLETVKQIYYLMPGLDGNAIKLALGTLGNLKNGEMIFISGPIGVGKTIAAIVLALVFVKTGNKLFRFHSSREILKQDFDKDEDVNNYWGGVIIVDDFGHEYFREDNNWGQDVWEDFIDTAYRESLPRIFTTNLTPDEIRKKYGERIYDRIKEVGIWLTIVEPGGSFRGRNITKTD